MPKIDIFLCQWSSGVSLLLTFSNFKDISLSCFFLLLPPWSFLSKFIFVILSFHSPHSRPILTSFSLTPSDGGVWQSPIQEAPFPSGLVDKFSTETLCQAGSSLAQCSISQVSVLNFLLPSGSMTNKSVQDKEKF